MPSQKQNESRARVIRILRDEMTARNWKQSDLAREAGTPASAIKAILDGTRGVGVSLGKRLAAVLKLELSDLLTEDGGALVEDTESKTKAHRISPKLRQLLGVTSDLADEDQTMLLGIAISIRNTRRKLQNDSQ